MRVSENQGSVGPVPGVKKVSWKMRATTTNPM